MSARQAKREPGNSYSSQLNENVKRMIVVALMRLSSSIMYVNTRSLVGGTVSGGLGGMALLEEVHCWGWAWRA